MRLGLSLPMFTADVRKPLDAAARAAEAGYDGVFAPDHLFPPSAPDRPALEPFTVLAAVAAIHPTLRVGTLVTRASLRPVGLLAKQAAAVDGIGDDGRSSGSGPATRCRVRSTRRSGSRSRPRANAWRSWRRPWRHCARCSRGTPGPAGPITPRSPGPLLPAGGPELRIGGRSDPVLDGAARSADAWNGWAMGADDFRAAAGRLGSFAGGRSVSPTWGGIVLVARGGTTSRACSRNAVRRTSI